MYILCKNMLLLLLIFVFIFLYNKKVYKDKNNIKQQIGGILKSFFKDDFITYYKK